MLSSYVKYRHAWISEWVTLFFWGAHLGHNHVKTQGLQPNNLNLQGFSWTYPPWNYHFRSWKWMVGSEKFRSGFLLENSPYFQVLCHVSFREGKWVKFSGCPLKVAQTNNIAIPKAGKQTKNMWAVVAWILGWRVWLIQNGSQIRHQILQLISHPFVFPFQNNEVFSSCIFVVWKRPSLTQNHFTDPTKPCNDETVPMACPMVSRCRIARTIGHSPCCCRSPKRGVVPSQDVAVVDSPWQGLEGRKRLGRIEMASEGWS